MMITKFAIVLLAVSFVQADIPRVWSTGYPEDEVKPRIIRGEDAKEREFPYMASLRRRYATPGHMCGASVLTRHWVLTAAHCCPSWNSARDFYVFAGSIYLSRGGSRHSIDRVIFHPQYGGFTNDICLIRVAEQFQFGDTVQQVMLPYQGRPVNQGDRLNITGWGRMSPNIIPDRLQKGIDFTALSNEECRRVTNIAMHSGYLCVYGSFPGQATWNGDSGGPLVRNGVQVGLTSFGFVPFNPYNPTVFTRVPIYVNWIKSVLGPEAHELKIQTSSQQ